MTPDVTDKKACYAAFKAHDARFDGRVFICVSSTGVYCRPVCRVKTPREENCSFHVSAGAAERAGFRPCRKCRPELAPGHAPVDAAGRLARQAALAVEADIARETGVSRLADGLGVGTRHLRRVFAAAYGVSPVQYLQTRRLLLAKSLLTDTDLPIIQVAFASGFGSLRRFNDLFRKRYRMSPTELRKRKRGGENGGEKGGVTVFLAYRPPYDWEAMLSFLETRAVPGVECVADGVYARIVAVRDGGTVRRGWIAVGKGKGEHVAAVTVSAELLPVISGVLSAVRCLFDLDADPAEVHEVLSRMDAVVPEVAVPGVRVPGCVDGFEMAVRAVLGQQITVAGARTLAARFAAGFGVPVAGGGWGLTHAFPEPEAIVSLPGPVEEHLGPLGITGARARTIAAIARAMAEGELELSPRADPGTQVERLLALPGVGPWTASYLAMRALAWPDAFPHTDYGVRKALPGVAAEDIVAVAEDWRPWRAYATVSLWNSLARG